MNTISKSELAGKLGSPGLIVVNVLPRGAYDTIHIKGSISVPLDELEAGRWKELDKGKEVVTHCSGYGCEKSAAAARFLEGQGFDAKAYEGGIREWAEADLPTEGTVSARQYLAERYGAKVGTPAP